MKRQHMLQKHHVIEGAIDRKKKGLCKNAMSTSEREAHN